jgi:hypothetical protein
MHGLQPISHFARMPRLTFIARLSFSGGIGST